MNCGMTYETLNSIKYWIVWWWTTLMQVDMLFETSKIVGEILNQYQIDYVMNFKKRWSVM